MLVDMYFKQGIKPGIIAKKLKVTPEFVYSSVKKYKNELKRHTNPISKPVIEP